MATGAVVNASEDSGRNSVGFLRGLVAGAAAGAVAAILFAIVDVLGAFRAARVPVEAAEFVRLAATSLAVFIPAFAVAAAALGAALVILSGISSRSARFVRWSMPVACAMAVFGYLAVWQVSARGALGYVGAAKLLILSFVMGIVIYGLLTVVARALAHGSVVRAAVPLVVCAGLWGLSVALAGPEPPPEDLPEGVRAGTPSSPNILLIVLDTVRADHMSCYGYQRRTTPNIDRFAEDARLYTNVLSPACWTLPTHASFFTGLPVSAHGCSWAHPYLDEEFETLAERLKAAGYQTAGLSSNGFVCAQRGFDQGFEEFWIPPGEGAAEYAFVSRALDRWGVGQTPATADLMHQRLGRWFREQRDPEKPFFIFLNYIEAHAPYTPQSHLLEWASAGALDKWSHRSQRKAVFRYMFSRQETLTAAEIAELEALYDDELRFVDAKVGELLGFLRGAGLYDRTLVIVTSDHGEHFGEHHMMEHQFSLYEPLVRVPLVVRLPERFKPGKDGTLVQSQDVFATMLQAAGLRIPGENSTASLPLPAEASEGRQRAVAEYLAPHAGLISEFSQDLPLLDFSPFFRSLRAVQSGKTKLITWSSGESELYDLEADPLEVHDLAGERAAVARDLGKALADWQSLVEPYVGRAPDVEEIAAAGEEERQDLEAMRGLGYIR